ncbi:STAS domain-containing protein [Rhodococcoides kyotonense]|uniref:Anti-anti-sigma regulatory factor (Antagonist of anti-sigma factor) n=1 Tax=Rhodococcoides kyotonense TaxID=398843 RepID=A0A239LI75_9NOCA|nr:STAS domain-containing protein [Rhodococcus kyotonensis]SNT30065.1 Anti-anti-sigma regulatory factor (antagonist of anti-sigma factor) [Rhodococcus kyotonensis]
MTVTEPTADFIAHIADQDPPEHTQRYAIDVESYSNDYAVLRASGELDMSARVDFVQALDRMALDNKHVRVDLSEVSFMYSGVANAIIDNAQINDGTVSVFAPTRPVRMILDVLGGGYLLVDE